MYYAGFEINFLDGTVAHRTTSSTKLVVLHHLSFTISGSLDIDYRLLHIILYYIIL